MSEVMKGMLIILVVLYVISPVDAMPLTPVDDFLVALFGIAASKRISD